MSNVNDESQRFSSVWDALSDTAEEAENLRLRSNLMAAITERIDEFGWSQAVAAQNLRVTQPRISDIYTGKLHRFSVDSLLKIARPLGVGVHVDVNLDSPFGRPDDDAVESESDRAACTGVARER